MANLLGTTVNGNLITSGGYTTSNYTRILYPSGGSYVTTTSVITGAIRIKLPTQGSAMMMTCTVKVYEYSTNKSFTITFGGHRDSANWYNEFCYLDGDSARGNLTVRFGVDDGKDCVWIGDTSTQWSYPQVFVTDVQLGYTGYNQAWASGWSVSFVTSFATVNRTQTAYAKITNANIGSQSVSYATTAGSAPNGSNLNTYYDVYAGVGNGLRFWGGSDSYKISMGVGTLYQYGTVSDYSIKMQMNDDSTGRGFTWGRISYAPIASLNSTSGDFQVAGSVRSTQFRLTNSTNNGYITGGDDWGVRFSNDNGWIQFGPANNSWTHIYSDKNFYFNQELYVNNVQVVKNSGTWGINITGSANSASSAGNADTVDSLHASDFVRAYTTTSDNIDSNWGQSFKTFDPVPSGTPPIDSPNLRTINVGEDFNRRTQLAFTYATDQAWFRRRDSSGWQTWREFIHSGNIGSQSVSYATNSGSLDGYDYSQFTGVLARYITTAGGSARIRITAPFNTNSSKMFSVDINMYAGYTQYKYTVSGYMYGSINQWYEPRAVFTGTGTPDIYVGRDNSGRAYISIANGNYTGIVVNNFVSGYVASEADAYIPWSITLDSGNENSVSVSVVTTITSANIASQSVSYAVTSGTSSATTQTNFTSLTVGGLDVATREYVTSQGYLTSLPSHNHDDRYYTETEINGITHQWQWRWIRWAAYLSPAGSSAAQWTDYYKTYFTERSTSTEASYGEQDSGYINTITNVDSNGGFGGSTYGNIFGDLSSYHCLIYTNIYVDKAFTVSVGNFNGDDPHAIFIDGVFVHGNIGCCVDTSYSYTFTQGWHRIDLIYSEGGGGDWIRMGWNPKDYTANIKDMTPHRAGENPRNILDKIKNLVIQSDQSVRAPIFYDSADTSYYIDPNATSRIDRLQVVSNWGGSTPNDGQINIRGMYPSMTFRNTVSNSMWLRHMDGDGHVQHYFATGGVDSVNWGIKHTMFNDGTFFSSGSMRSPIFYDSNDTTYYLDPASNATSLNVRGVIRNPSIWINDGDDYNSYNENIRLFDAPNGVSVIAFSASGTEGSPRTSLLGFSDRLETRVGDTWEQRIYSGYVEARGSFRAPIFIDSNDTNYYLNPNSYSQLSAVFANDWFRPQGNSGLYFQSYGRGIWAADSAGSSYGNVSIYGDGVNSWPGYAINSLACFMARDIRRGIFIPSADSWLIRYESGDGMAHVDFELQWGSDIRHKSNIKRISRALDKVKQLKGVTYNYKGNERTSIGFIAQEVEPVLPEVVSTDGDGFKSVGYANIVALLSEAIKEQQVMIDELRAEIDALKSK